MVSNKWHKIELGDLCTTITSGSRDWAQYYADEGTPFIRMTNLQRENIWLDLSDLKRVNVKSNSSDGIRTSLQHGDILMSITAELGKIGWIDESLGKAYINQHTALIRIDEKKAFSMFVAYLLSSKDMNKKINRLNDSGAKAGLNLSTLRNLTINLPPLPEQKKIAEILSTWDKAIETVEKLVANSQQQKKALMQQLLTGQIRFFNKDSQYDIPKGILQRKLGLLPTDWKVEHIKNHIWFQEGPGVRNSQFKESGIKLFNGTNIQFNKINLQNTNTYISEDEGMGTYKHFLVDDGDLLIACSGISVNRFDEKIAFVNKSHLPLCMNTSTMRFKQLENGLVNIKYFYYFMQTWLFKNQIRGQATGSAQLNFGPSHISNCFVAFPNIEEQEKIAHVLTLADREIDLYKEQLDNLKLEKKSLMQQLLTGQKRVKID